MWKPTGRPRSFFFFKCIVMNHYMQITRPSKAWINILHSKIIMKNIINKHEEMTFNLAPCSSTSCSVASRNTGIFTSLSWLWFCDYNDHHPLTMWLHCTYCKKSILFWCVCVLVVKILLSLHLHLVHSCVAPSCFLLTRPDFTSHFYSLSLRPSCFFFSPSFCLTSSLSSVSSLSISAYT